MVHVLCVIDLCSSLPTHLTSWKIYRAFINTAKKTWPIGGWIIEVSTVLLRKLCEVVGGGGQVASTHTSIIKRIDLVQHIVP